MGDQTKIEQLGMLGVVIVLLQLDARVGNMFDGDVEPLAIANLLHQVGQVEHAELLGELVEYPVFALCRWALDGDLNAPQRVANVQKASGLPALAIDGKRASQRRLHTIAIQHRTPNAVVVKTRGQSVIKQRFVCLQTVHNPLIQVGRSEEHTSELQSLR